VERDFWLERWRLGQIGFHQSSVNARLQQFWPTLEIEPDTRVFVPLCGKSGDMWWLAQRGHPVVGVELSTIAIETFFDEAAAPYEVRQQGRFAVYDGKGITILCGDFFALTAADLRDIGAVFDRASLIALPPPMRARYAAHLLDVLPIGVQSLLLTIEYDQSRAAGPPFSVRQEEVEALFTPRCRVDALDRRAVEEVPPRFHAEGIRQVFECSYRLVKER